MNLGSRKNETRSAHGGEFHGGHESLNVGQVKFYETQLDTQILELTL